MLSRRWWASLIAYSRRAPAISNSAGCHDAPPERRRDAGQAIRYLSELDQASFPSAKRQAAFETKPELGPDIALARIVASLREALDSQGLGARDLLSIGVSCGGPLNRERGVIQAPPNLSTWHDVPICTLLEREFSAPCRIENDANAGALAEARFGAGRGCRNLIF